MRHKSTCAGMCIWFHAVSSDKVTGKDRGHAEGMDLQSSRRSQLKLWHWWINCTQCILHIKVSRNFQEAATWCRVLRVLMGPGSALPPLQRSWCCWVWSRQVEDCLYQKWVLPRGTTTDPCYWLWQSCHSGCLWAFHAHAGGTATHPNLTQLELILWRGDDW